MSEKKSFLLYTGYFEQIEMLNIEQRGILLTAIMAFQTDSEMPEMDALTKMAFSFISADMRRDNEKYEEIVERRKESGRKGGLATQAKRASASSASFASNSEIKQNQANQANQAVNVNVNENVNDNENVNVNVSVVPDDDTTTHIPLMADIRNEIAEKGYRLDSDSINRFVQYNREKGWKMNWKEALKKWVEKEQPNKSPAGKFANFPQRDDQEYRDLVNKVIKMNEGI